MNDLRRTLVWGVFLFSLIFLWDAWQVHNGRPATFFPDRTAATHQTPASPSPSASNGAGDIPGASSNTQQSNVTAQAPVVNDAMTGEKIVVTTDAFKVTFDTVGARITTVDLLKFADQTDKEQPVRLVNPAYNYQVQMGLIDSQQKLAFPRHDSPMQLIEGPLSLADGQDTLTVSFQSEEIGGLRVIQSYEFTRGSYVIKVSTQIINEGTQAVTPEMYYRLVRNSDTSGGGSSMFWNTFTGFAYYTDENRYSKIAFSDITNGTKTLNSQATDGWVGMVQHYFVTAWLPAEGSPREYFTSKLSGNNYAIGLTESLQTLQPNERYTVQARLYSGPQEEKIIEKLSPGLDLVKDYGMFKILSKPLFWLLDFLHSILNNWGWSIVALVVLIKAAFFWLNARAYRSMAKMKAVGPRLQELRERYKDNPQQMQQETMRIYREEKINPLGGCLPIIIQIPVFIALYWVLLSSVEMRNAPWILWITDLSAKDPYYILPLIMTGSTLLQTWLNPKPADPMQAKMMWIMPLVFSVMFFMFPAGLVLYWVTNNLLSIAQQWFINKKLGVTK